MNNARYYSPLDLLFFFLYSFTGFRGGGGKHFSDSECRVKGPKFKSVEMGLIIKQAIKQHSISYYHIFFWIFIFLKYHAGFCSVQRKVIEKKRCTHNHMLAHQTGLLRHFSSMNSGADY